MTHPTEVPGCLVVLLITLGVSATLFYALIRLTKWRMRGGEFHSLSFPKITWKFSLKYATAAIAIAIVIMLVKSSVVITPCKEKETATVQKAEKKCDCPFGL